VRGPGRPWLRRYGRSERRRGPRVGQGARRRGKDRGRVPADLIVKFKAATS